MLFNTRTQGRKGMSRDRMDVSLDGGSGGRPVIEKGSTRGALALAFGGLARRRRRAFAVLVTATAVFGALAPVSRAEAGSGVPTHATSSSAAISEFTLPTAGSAPTSITKGPDGNLWFTENSGNNIGRIDTSGTITEYSLPTAGSQPQGITSGPDGAMWFTEFNNGMIGRITTGGAIREFAVPTVGAGPWGITSGPDGNLWFVEANTGNVGKVTTGGVFSEYTTGSFCPTNITSGPDGNLWFVDVCGRFGSVTIGGVATVPPFSAIQGYPTDITNGPDGNLWMAMGSVGNQFGEAARLTPPTSLTKFRTPSSGIPQGITAGSNGALWMTDSGNQIVESSPSGVMTTFPLPRTGVNATAITSGPDSNIWFVETSGNAIGKLTVPGSCATNGAGVDHPDVGPGVPVTITLTVLDCGSGPVTQATTTTTTTPPGGCTATPLISEVSAAVASGQSVARSTTFNAPSCLGDYMVTSTATADGVAIGTASVTYTVAVPGLVGYPVNNAKARPLFVTPASDGNLWFTQDCCAPGTDGHVVVQMSTTGTITTFTTLRGRAREVTWGPDGKVWLAEDAYPQPTTSIASLDTSGQTILELPTQEPSINAMAAGPDGNVWFAASNSVGGGDLGRVRPDGRIKLFHVLSSGAPGSVAAGPDGNMWFTAGDQLGRLTMSGNLTLFTIGGGGRARDIALGPDGNMWFTYPSDVGPSSVGRITPAGVISLYSTSSQPFVITAGADGNMWFTEYSAGPGRITPSGVVTEFPDPGNVTNNAQFSIAGGPDGNVWTAAYYGDDIGQIGIGPPSACAPVSAATNPATVTGGATETVTSVMTNCASIPRVLKLVTKTIPPSGCGTATTTSVSVPLGPRLGTTETSSFVAPSCAGLYKVKAALMAGGTVVGSTTLTYQVT